MDIETTGYRIADTEESVERYLLEEQDYRLSGPIVIDGINIGFVAVRFDDEQQVTQAVVVVVVED